MPHDPVRPLRFGLIGLFVGPVILAILLALWREWAADGETQPTRPHD